MAAGVGDTGARPWLEQLERRREFFCCHSKLPMAALLSNTIAETRSPSSECELESMGSTTGSVVDAAHVNSRWMGR